MLHRVVDECKAVVDVVIIDLATLAFDDLADDVHIFGCDNSIVIRICVWIEGLVPFAIIGQLLQKIEIMTVDEIIIVGVAEDLDIPGDVRRVFAIAVVENESCSAESRDEDYRDDCYRCQSLRLIHLISLVVGLYIHLDLKLSLNTSYEKLTTKVFYQLIKIN